MESKRFNELLQKLNNKDEAAFEELYNEYAAKAYIAALGLFMIHFMLKMLLARFLKCFGNVHIDIRI